MVGPDGIPVLGAAIGVGIALTWTVIGSNRDHAREVLTKEMQSLRTVLDERDADVDELRKAKLVVEKYNAKLEVQISRLQAERGS